jgi:hypothetical protein
MPRLTTRDFGRVMYSDGSELTEASEPTATTEMASHFVSADLCAATDVMHISTSIVTSDHATRRPCSPIICVEWRSPTVSRIIIGTYLGFLRSLAPDTSQNTRYSQVSVVNFRVYLKYVTENVPSKSRIFNGICFPMPLLNLVQHEICPGDYY